MKRIFPPHLFIALACATSISITTVAHAQVTGPGVPDSLLFDTVINIPTDPDIGDGATIGGMDQPTTQLNLFNGGTIGSLFGAEAGSEVNIFGGSVGTNFSATNSVLNISDGFLESVVAGGSTVDMSGGFIGNNFRVLGSEVNISDGNIGGLLNVAFNSTVNISGGDVSALLVRANSEVNITGGNFGFNLDSPFPSDTPPFLTAATNSTLNISGGTFEGNPLNANGGGEVNLLGTEFFVDGVRLESLQPDDPFLIADRDVTLSGTLLDGSTFDFSIDTSDDDPTTSTFTVSTVSAIPEPSGFALLLVGGVVCLLNRRRDDRQDSIGPKRG